MDDWKFVQYKKVVDLFLAKLNIDLGNPDIDKQGNLEQRLDILLTEGNRCGMPVSEHLTDGIFQLRAKEDCKQIRLAYFFMPQRTICFIHAFIKKTRQTSSNDIKMAKKNKNNAEKERKNIDEFNFSG